MTLKFGEVKSRRRVGAVISTTRKTVSSGDRHSHKNEEYYKNKAGVVEWKRVDGESKGNSRTRFQLAQEPMSSLPHLLALTSRVVLGYCEPQE